MPRVPKLFIDKLVITVRFDSSRAEAVRQAIEDSFEWSDAIEPIDIDISNYSENFQFVAPNGHKATLQMGPRNRRNNNFRLEYSPNNLGAAGRAALGEYLRDTLGDGYLTDIRNGRLTRLDLAFDVRRIRLKDLMIVDLRSRKTSIIRGEQGEVETYYLPFNEKNRCKNQFCIYDKLKERIDKEGPISASRRPADWVRFEYRHRSLKGYTLDTLFRRMENPFRDNFSVKQFGITDAPIDADNLRLFFDACRLAGVDSVLEEIPDTQTRDIYSLAYRTFPVPYFWRRRTSIWAGFQAAVENAKPE